ncbi:TolC family protein [Hydrogenophaga sp.]|uniref:TolC family protein n=1 Tax=Hydrogenophaga sp. TaxID=1904254 RepID=UPI003F6EAC7C
MPFSRWPAAWLAALAMTAAHAAEPTPQALQAADPRHPSSVPPLQWPPMGDTTVMELPADIDQARAVWQRANQRVAEFPRGHVDLLQWEARQPGAGDATPATTGDTPLSFAAALQRSLSLRPDLFVHAGMNAPEQAEVRVRFANHVRELQRAWIDAAAARQRLRLMTEVHDAARTGSELGQRMVNAGNWSQARLTRERLLQASAWSAVLESQARELSARERLARLLGQWQADDVTRLGEGLDVDLPAPPKQLSPGPGLDATTLETAVLRSHPTLARDRQLAQRQFDAMNRERRQAWQRAVNGALRTMPDAGSAGTLQPPRIEDLSLLRDHPLVRAAQVESDLLRQATERRSMAREAWAQLQLRHAATTHAQDVVVALQGSLAQDSLLRYNGMLQSTWELLASARERLRALDEALQARRDFWLAQADWQALLSGADYRRADNPSTSGAATSAPAGH